VVDLDDEDWRVVCDELTYQIARYLAKHETIKLPNLGTLDIAYGEHGPIGRLTLAPEARP
jgi:nucleoid DNA-binding protein